jgi:threonine aldolase
MLSNEFKADYLQLIGNCHYSLIRHPKLSMAEQLQALIPLSEKYSESETYGKGRLINEFEQEIADLLGHPSALFVPSGTMAQLIALRIWADQKNSNKVAFHPLSHLQLHEQNAYKELHALEACMVGDVDRVVTLGDLNKLKQSISALLLELPMREIGGQLPDWQDLVNQRQWATENDVALHLDGARLWSCSDCYDKPLAEISGLFDSVYVSFYKDLDGIAGAMLLGSNVFIEQARTWLRRCGGNLITMFPDVLAAKVGVSNNLPLMDEFVLKAKKVAAYFNDLTPFRTIPLHPQVNLFHLEIDQVDSLLMPKIASWSAQNEIAILPWPRSTNGTSSRFEITIGKNALQLSDITWQHAIHSLGNAL